MSTTDVIFHGDDKITDRGRLYARARLELIGALNSVFYAEEADDPPDLMVRVYEGSVFKRGAQTNAVTRTGALCEMLGIEPNDVVELWVSEDRTRAELRTTGRKHQIRKAKE